MNYSDLKIGMLFNIHSEDHPVIESNGHIVDLGRTKNDFIYAQFDDELLTYTQGQKFEILPNCFFLIK